MILTSKTTPTSGHNRRLIFFGNERIATGTTTTNPVLRMLLAEGYDIAAIVLHHTPSASRKQRDPEILAIARHHGIPVLYPAKMTDCYTELTSYGAHAGILVAFGKLVPESTITIFPRGIINIHPSALPKHRGPTPLESVILDGSDSTAVSIMALARKMDAGPIYAQVPLALSGQETKQQLADTLLELSSHTLRNILPGILDGSCRAVTQDHTAATYDSLITKDAGLLDPTKPATVLERQIRAYAGWPGGRLNIGGKDVTIITAHVAQNNFENVDNKTIFTDKKQLCLQTGSGILILDTLKPAGKAAMPASAFLAGYSQLLRDN